MIKSTPLVQTCNQCGRNVAPDSGFFVNRVADGDSVAERKERGCRYPRGDFICRECDEKAREVK